MTFTCKPFREEALVSELVDIAPPRWRASRGVRQHARWRQIPAEDDSWLLIRPSGTEPVLRVYAEAHTPRNRRELAGEGRALADAAGV